MIEQMRIGMMSGGDPEAYDRYLAILHWRQDIGEIRIIDVNEEIATVEILDPRLARICGGGHARTQ